MPLLPSPTFGLLKNHGYRVPADYELLQNKAVTWSLDSSGASSYKYSASIALPRPINLIGNSSYAYHAFEVDFDITLSSVAETPPDWWGNAEPGYTADYCPGAYEAPLAHSVDYSTYSDHIGNNSGDIIGVDIRRSEIVAQVPTNAAIGQQQLVFLSTKAGGACGVRIVSSYYGLLVPLIAGGRADATISSVSFKMNIHECGGSGLISNVTINSSTLKALFVQIAGADGS